MFVCLFSPGDNTHTLILIPDSKSTALVRNRSRSLGHRREEEEETRQREKQKEKGKGGKRQATKHKQLINTERAYQNRQTRTQKWGFAHFWCPFWSRRKSHVLRAFMFSLVGLWGSNRNTQNSDYKEDKFLRESGPRSSRWWNLKYLGVKNVVDFWWQIFCQFSPREIGLKHDTESFTTFFTVRKEIYHLDLTLGASSPIKFPLSDSAPQKTNPSQPI